MARPMPRNNPRAITTVGWSEQKLINRPPYVVMYSAINCLIEVRFNVKIVDPATNDRIYKVETESLISSTISRVITYFVLGRGGSGVGVTSLYVLVTNS
jgi:hypothetical protein